MALQPSWTRSISLRKGARDVASFKALTIDDMISLRDPATMAAYTDGLALIDDLLCEFDPERSGPYYAPDENPDHLDHPGLVQREVRHVIDGLEPNALKDNLESNLVAALALRDEILEEKRVQPALGFLEALVDQYRVVLRYLS